MTSTSISLLQRLSEDPDNDDWQALVRQYAPKVRGWLRKRGIAEADADDIAQDVMSVLVRRIAEFQRQRTGSFRRWVRTMTVNCMRDHLRKQNRSPKAVGGSEMVELLNELADDSSQLSQKWDDEHARYWLAILLKRIRPEFRDATWDAFTQVAVNKVPPQTVAKELEMSVNAVFVAKSRVLKRLREEGAGLID